MNDPILTIFCSFTRGWALERWLQNLSNLDYDPKLINLAFIVDCNDVTISSRLIHLDNETYRSFSLDMNRDWNPNEVVPVERRRRIAQVKRESKALVERVDGDYVFSLEDDTVFDGLDIRRLFIPFEGSLTTKKVGMVEGVQCGRWGKKMIGAWKFDDLENPTTLTSLTPKKGFQEIDAGGFYGYLTTRRLYLECPYIYNGEAWGPDVNAGIWLRKHGYTNFIDWETKFGHNNHNIIIYPDKDIVKAKFWKRGETWFPVVP